MKKKKRILGIRTTAVVTAFAFIMSNFAAFSAFAEDAPQNIVVIAPQEELAPQTEFAEQPDIGEDATLPAFEEPEFAPMYSFPENMRGVYITPTADYAVPDEDGNMPPEEEITESVEKMLDKAYENKLNSVIIMTDLDGRAFYSADMNRTVETPLIEYAIDAAKDRGFYVYLNFSIDHVLEGLKGDDLRSRIDRLAITVHGFTVKYPVDGIILDGYYSSKNNVTISDYMKDGSGIGYENWLPDNSAYIFSLAADAVRRTNNTVPVGISINDVWANYTTKENGSETSVDFEALTDGYADTMAYIEKGYADFIMLRAEGSISDSEQPFNKILGWWNSRAEEADIPLYVRHINERICTDAEGWGSPDELVKQVIAASDYGSYGGSAFNSLSSLEKDVMQSTEALMKHYDDEIDLEGLNSELEMTLPKKTTFKTEEPTVIFAGSFDPNFPVYYQGKEIKLNEAGRFYFTEDLDVGVNTFRFQNKAKVITYKITRTVNVLKSVSPADDTMRVEEQSTITLSAIAYRGSDVTASINGKSVTLKEAEGQLDELDPNSNYTKYIGYYTAPAGKRGEDINLGNVEFHGTYHAKSGNISESRTGSRIIVNALAEVANDYSGSLLRVNSDNTMVYNYKSTSNSPTPDCARLPAGTLDYLVKSVTYSGTDYYLTNSGKRIKKNAVTVLENKPLGNNPMSVVSAGKDGTDTVIKLKTAAKIPFSLNYDGQSYSDGGNGGYYVSSFSANAITLTFDYVTSVKAGDISFPDSAVFTTGTWNVTKSGDMTKTKLTLKLRQNGVFSGLTSTYDSDDNLVLRFNGCRNSLNGATIVIDPGHGYTGRSAFDPGAVGHIKEQTANLAISKYLAEMLEADGAKVIRYKTESETYPTEERSDYARRYSPDLYISVHCNSNTGEKPNGSEAYYFTPFSQPVAKYVSAELGSYMKNNVNPNGSGNRGEKYNYYWVTLQQEFPSILIETGFVSNYTDAMALADASHQKNFARAIEKGVKRYFESTGYSCYGDGSATWNNIGGNDSDADSGNVPQPEEPAVTEADDPWKNDNFYDPDDPYYQFFGQ